MVPRFSSVLLASLVALPVLAAGTAFAGEPSVRDVDETQSAENQPEMRTHPNGFQTGFVWVDPIEDLAPDAVASDHISKIIFVNRCAGGCSITPGNNDARANTSSIPSSSSVLSEFMWDQEKWDATIACIKEVYSPYDVEIVEEDPGPDVFHHEAILAGTPGEIGLEANVGGIAPSGCSPLNNVISFSFANSNASQGGDVETMCWTVAQESAHAFGLPNHVFNCLDPMTYLDGCGRKYFRNQSFPCGEFSQSSCNCSGATQNSHVELDTVFGPGTAPPPPELTLLLPKDGDAVLDNFAIYWDSQDPRLVLRNEMWINGTKYRDVPGHPYDNRFDDYNTTAPDLPDGVIDIEVRSYNELGSESIESITVTKGSPCSSPDSCFEFQTCNEGRCEYPPASAGLGDSCDVTPQCTEGVCGSVGSTSTCTVTCNPTVTGGCDDGFECKSSNSGDFVCWPEGDTGGCCSVAGTKRDPIPWLAGSLFLLGFMLLRRRRV